MCHEVMKAKTVEGTILDLYVKPKSKEFKIEGENEVFVFCREAPVKNRVNKELVKELSKVISLQRKVWHMF